MNNENLKFDTIAVHGGYDSDPATHAVTTPIYLTNAYAFEDTDYAADIFALRKEGNIYTRITNPTQDMLEKRVAMLEGGTAALAFASGHAAIFNTIINLANAGDEIVSAIQIYGGAINLLGVTLERLGIKVNFVDADDFEAWENAINEKTKAFFFEVIGNPNANVVDIQKIAGIAHKHGIPVIADSTTTSPYLCRPFDFGADIVVHSATKYLGGHGTVMGGIVVDGGTFNYKDNPRFPLYNEPDSSYHGIVYADLGKAAFAARLRTLMLRDVGACLSPFNCFMIMQGIETLSLRMERHCENTLKIAEYLENHEQVSFVNYPMLKTSPYYDRAQKYFPKGASGVFTFGIKGGKDAGAKFINNLKLFTHCANLGDVRSLASHPATTTHSQLSPKQLEESGITESTIRLSIGIEDVEDLIADIEQAIQS